MNGRPLLLLAALAIAGGATAVAVEWPADVADRTPSALAARVSLPATGLGALPVCSGPETLAVPAGGKAELPGGPVVAGGLVQGRSATLGGRSLVAGDGGLSLLTVPLTSAGPVVLQTDASGTQQPAPDGSPAMSSVQLSLARSGDNRGLAAMACPTAGTQTWLVGGGTQDGRRGRLLLANPAATPAVVDVTVHGPHGVVAAPGGKGVVVPPKGEVAVFVDAFAPGLDAVAVQVQARSGRVAAVLRDTWVRGVTPGGTDDVTEAAPAARTQYVPGIDVAPAAGTSLSATATDPGAVVVRVVNPGSGAAVARVRLMGGSGALTIDHAVTTIQPGAVVDVPITGVPRGTYTAVVDADSPVLAGAVIGREVSGSSMAGTQQAIDHDVPPSEFAWASSVEPLTSAALMALPTLTENGRRVPLTTTLSLAAPGAASTVEVTELDAQGSVLRTSTVDVAAGISATSTLGSGVAGVAGVRIRPLDGRSPVVAGLALEVQDPAGPLLSVLPVRPGPAGGGGRPELVADVRTGLRG